MSMYKFESCSPIDGSTTLTIVWNHELSVATGDATCTKACNKKIFYSFTVK